MDMSWVLNRMAVGGGIWIESEMREVAKAGITHIIDMQVEFDDTQLAKRHGITVLWNPVDDDFEPKETEVFRSGVEFALAVLEAPSTKLYVHCAAGVHRAPMMALAVLRAMGHTLPEAIRLIESKRKTADFPEVYVRSVEAFMETYGKEERLSRQ